MYCDGDDTYFRMHGISLGHRQGYRKQTIILLILVLEDAQCYFWHLTINIQSVIDFLHYVVTYKNVHYLHH